MQVIVLNADYSYLNTIGWKRALNLLIKGKAEPVKESDKVITNSDGSQSFHVPLVMRLVNFVKTVYKGKVHYSRRNVFIRDGHQCQ